jgi:trimeric autotransporter adhesin
MISSEGSASCSYPVKTVAGTLGSGGYSGNGYYATSAKLYYPYSSSTDKSGNLYIADYYNHMIRRVSAETGFISTVAGTAGYAGYCCDSAPATSAYLYNPSDVIADITGNLYIADTSNNRIRYVSAGSGIISTYAGTGTASSTGDGGWAIYAALNNPSSIALDISGNLYIADTNNHLVRKVATNGIITTVAGLGSPPPLSPLTYYFYPQCRTVITVTCQIPMYASGPSCTYCGSYGAGCFSCSWFIGYSYSNCAQAVCCDSGWLGSSTVYCKYNGVNYGYDYSSWLSAPYGVAVDSAGNLFIADTGNYKIRRIDAVTGSVRTVVGNGTSGTSANGLQGNLTLIGSVYKMAFDGSDNLYFADNTYNKVRVLKKSTQTVNTVMGNGQSTSSVSYGPLSSAQLSPYGVGVGFRGDLYVSDTVNSVVWTTSGESMF